MSEAVMDSKVVEMKPKLKRVMRPRVEAITPTQIVDVWRLVENSLYNGNQIYPDVTNEPREVMQSHLFNYLQTPTFAGLIAKVGKRPAGVILGHVNQRPYGLPKRFAFVWCMWVEPGFRKTGVGQLLWKEYTERLKKAGIFHWEANTQEHLAKELVREAGIPVQKLMTIVGGRL